MHSLFCCYCCCCCCCFVFKIQFNNKSKEKDSTKEKFVTPILVMFFFPPCLAVGYSKLSYLFLYNHLLMRNMFVFTHTQKSCCVYFRKQQKKNNFINKQKKQMKNGAQLINLFPTLKRWVVNKKNGHFSFCARVGELFHQKNKIKKNSCAFLCLMKLSILKIN